MANFINGRRLRKYSEPLTTKILKKLRAAQNAKEQKERVKIEAQAEAKLRAQKNQEKRYSLYQLYNLRCGL